MQFWSLIELYPEFSFNLTEGVRKIRLRCTKCMRCQPWPAPPQAVRVIIDLLIKLAQMMLASACQICWIAESGLLHGRITRGHKYSKVKHHQTIFYNDLIWPQNDIVVNVYLVNAEMCISLFLRAFEFKNWNFFMSAIISWGPVGQVIWHMTWHPHSPDHGSHLELPPPLYLQPASLLDQPSVN